MYNIILPEQTCELGFGIKSNHINILRYESNWNIKLIEEQLKKFNIPLKRFNSKYVMVKFLNTITLDDIKLGYILLIRCNIFTVTNNMFKNNIKQNNITIITVGYDKWKTCDIISFGRKQVNIDDFGLTLKAWKINKLMQTITNK